MKSLVLVIVLAIHTCYGMPTNNSSPMYNAAHLKAIFLAGMKEQCYQNSTKRFEHFTELTDNFMKCIATMVGEYPLFVTPLKTLKENIQSCANDLIEEQEDCLPDDAKDSPQLNLDIGYSILDFLYENKDEIFTPKVRTFMQNCVDVLQKEGPTSQITKCFNMNSPSFRVKVLCQEFVDVEKCIKAALSEKCPGDDDIEKLKSGFLQSMVEPCNDHEVTDNPVDNVFTLLAPYAPPNINPDLM